MMFNLKKRCPELLDCRDTQIELRSCSNVKFKENRLNSKIYVNSPYERGNNLWKQLPSKGRRQYSTDAVTNLPLKLVTSSN